MQGHECTFIYMHIYLLSNPIIFFPLMHGRWFNLSTSIQMFPKVCCSQLPLPLCALRGRNFFYVTLHLEAQASHENRSRPRCKSKVPPSVPAPGRGCRQWGRQVSFDQLSNRQQRVFFFLFLLRWLQQIEIGLVTKHSQTIRLRSRLLGCM